MPPVGNLTELLVTSQQQRAFIFAAQIQAVNIDEKVRVAIHWVVSSVLLGTVSVFGIVTNSINIAVFLAIGFKETVNISLLSLAVSDLLSLIPLLWIAITYNPELSVETLSFIPVQLGYLVGTWPHLVFVRISGWIIAYVTFERFLYIAFPMKVRQMVNASTVKITLVVIAVSVVASCIPVYFVAGLVWTYIPRFNRSILVLGFYPDKQELQSIVVFLNNVFSATASLSLVAAFTLAIVIKLKHKARVRKAMDSSSTKQEDSFTTRDKMLSRMLVTVSTIFIIFLSPTLVITVLTVFIPDFKATGKYVKIQNLALIFTFLFEAINSSANLFVYYRLSSNYREKLDRMLTKCCGMKNQNDAETET